LSFVGHSLEAEEETSGKGRAMASRTVEELALAAWEALPDASSLVFDTDLRYVVARGPALALHGFTSPDLEGQLAASSLPPERWKLFEPLYRGALVGERGSVEVSSLAEGRWCRVQVGPLRGPDGSTVGGVALAVDTTALKQSEHHYRALLESAPDGMVLVDAEGIIQVVNAEALRMFGYEREELVGASIELLMPERSRRQHLDLRAAFTREPENRPMGGDLNLRARRKDGSEFPVDIGLTSLGTTGGGLTAAVIRDVEAESKLAASFRLLEALQSAAPVGLVFVDLEFRIQRINDTLTSLYGLSADELIGRPAAEVFPTVWRQLGPACQDVLDSREAIVNRDLHVETDDDSGNFLTFVTSLYPVFVRGEMVGIGAVALDVTGERTAAEFREAVLDSMDEGLYSEDAAGLLTMMNAAASRMLGFSEAELLGKPIHETIHFQHADGSPYPVEECKLSLVRSEGRTFATSADAYTRKDGTILPVAVTATPLRGLGDRHGAVVVFHDTSQEHAETLRTQRELEALTWVGRIREALDEDRLVLYSQPIVPLNGGTPRVELLLRMTARSGEIIPPGSFLPVAEKYGLSREIDLWVIEQAIQLVANRQEAVHVNMSASSIGNLDLLPSIEKLLRKYQPDPSRLVVEITETALIGNVDAGEAFVHGLADLGIAIALDDFGTGFGSFTYLTRLPVQLLKIDIEFIRDLATSEHNQHLIRAIVLLAKGFKQLTVAEGVENAATLQLLRDYDVDFAQGFHIGRPAPLARP